MKLSSILKSRKFEQRYEDDSNSTTPFDIYLPYIFKALDIVNIGVGYCFIRTKGNARARAQSETLGDCVKILIFAS